MFPTYDQYQRSDQGGKDYLMRTLFETVAMQQKQIEELKAEIAQIRDDSKPLNRLANGTKSWLPRFNGNDAG